MTLSRFTAPQPSTHAVSANPKRGGRLGKLFVAGALGLSLLFATQAHAAFKVSNSTNEIVTVKYKGALNLASGRTVFVDTSWEVQPGGYEELKYNGESIKNKSLSYTLHTKHGTTGTIHTQKANARGYTYEHVYENEIKAPSAKVVFKNKFNDTVTVKALGYYDKDGAYKLATGQWTLRPGQSVSMKDIAGNNVVARRVSFKIDWKGGLTTWQMYLPKKMDTLNAELHDYMIAPPRSWKNYVSPRYKWQELQFTATSDTTKLTLQLINTSKTGSLKIYVYDEKNKLVTSYTRWGTFTKYCYINIKKQGRYRVKVESSSTTSTTNFTLNITETRKVSPQREVKTR